MHFRDKPCELNVSEGTYPSESKTLNPKHYKSSMPALRVGLGVRVFLHLLSFSLFDFKCEPGFLQDFGPGNFIITNPL